MEIKVVNGHQWLCLPVIGSVLAFLGLLWAVLAGSFGAMSDDQNTQYEVTYKDEYGNTRTKIENGSGAGGFLMGALMCAVLYKLGEQFIGVLESWVKSPLIFVAPVYVVGLASYFYQSRLNDYSAQRIYYEEGVKAHFIFAALLSFYIPKQMLGRLDFLEFMVFYLPMVAIFFLGILGPLSVSLTLVTGFYRATLRYRGLMGLIFTRMNLVLIGAIAITAYTYSWLNNITSYPELSVSLADKTQFMYAQAGDWLVKERGIDNWREYVRFLGYSCLFIGVLWSITLLMKQSAVRNNEHVGKAWFAKHSWMVVLVVAPGALSAVFWLAPATGVDKLAPELVLAMIEKVRITFEYSALAASTRARYDWGATLAADLAWLAGIASLCAVYQLLTIKEEIIKDDTKKKISILTVLIHLSFVSLACSMVWAAEQHFLKAAGGDTYLEYRYQTPVDANPGQIALHIKVVGVTAGGAQSDITSEARIRIMNIKPAFTQGMQLPSSEYDIEVSANGYKTHRRWHSLHQAQQHIVIRLMAEQPSGTQIYL